MLCPVCRYDNFEGEAQCANCGADLAAADGRPPLAEDDGNFLGERVDALPIGDLWIVDPGYPVADAIRKMHGSDTDCLLVCEEGRLIGIFTDRDASVKAVDKRLGLFKVRDFMTADPVVLRHEDTVAVAVNKMAVGGFRHLPIVVDGDRPTGVLTAADLFRHIVSLLG